LWVLLDNGINRFGLHWPSLVFCAMKRNLEGKNYQQQCSVLVMWPICVFLWSQLHFHGMAMECICYCARRMSLKGVTSVVILSTW
jgi:hypothetical protein